MSKIQFNGATCIIGKYRHTFLADEQQKFADLVQKHGETLDSNGFFQGGIYKKWNDPIGMEIVCYVDYKQV